MKYSLSGPEARVLPARFRDAAEGSEGAAA